MKDALYSNQKLVDAYDHFNNGDEDHCFYRKQVGARPSRILDLGCGTGVLAVGLAGIGHGVTAIEPAAKMLEVASKRVGSEQVCWLRGDARAIPPDLRFDAALMTGHAFQCLLSDEDIDATVCRVRASLAPGGRFMFESRNPLDRAWERWTKQKSAVTVLDQFARQMTAYHSVLCVHGQLVSFQTEYQLVDCRITSESTLRFLPRQAIDRCLRTHGFSEISCFGDWSGSPFTCGSREIIVIAA